MSTAVVRYSFLLTKPACYLYASLLVISHGSNCVGLCHDVDMIASAVRGKVAGFTDAQRAKVTRHHVTDIKSIRPAII
jgi:hypothetical protein